jgi:LysM repeat protein
MRYNLKTLISIITIISFLSPITASAKITPKKIKKGVKVEVITIKKGDTLWDLAKLYYKNPYMWKKFEEFNTFTNPDLIYPGEKLIISAEDAKKIKEILEKRAIEVKEEIKAAKAKKKLLKKKKEKPKEKEVEIKEIIKIKEVKVPVADETLLKKIARLEKDLKWLKERSRKTMSQKEKKVIELMDQVAYLKEEEEMLRQSILELEEKLSGEKIEVAKLKKEKEESEELTHFLAVGVICGIVLLNAFK